MKRIPTFVLALIVSTGAAFAGQEYTGANDYAASGYDVVAYFGLEQAEVGQPQPGAVPGRTDITVEHDGAEYAFASEENREMFLADPEKYAPQYDGHCAFGVAKGGKVPGNPNLWRIVDGKLYLNITQTVSDMWQQDIPGNLQMSEANWTDLEAAPASTDPIPEFEPMAPIN